MLEVADLLDEWDKEVGPLAARLQARRAYDREATYDYGLIRAYLEYLQGLAQFSDHCLRDCPLGGTLALGVEGVPEDLDLIWAESLSVGLDEGYQQAVKLRERFAERYNLPAIVLSA